MTEYASNSHKSREKKVERPEKFEKAIQGTAKTRKKSEVRKFADIFLAEDISNVKSYIVADVVIPALKKGLSDIVTNGIDMLLYGENGRRSSNNNSVVHKVSYSKYYDRDKPRQLSGTSRRQNGYNYDDVVVDTRGEAETIISTMEDAIEQYGMLSVADMYDLVGITANHTDYKYGWTDISSAEAIRIRDGYVIKMPRALPLD